jgi:methylated-DNA-protein-cysteine methyltransferase-like protein
MRAGDGQPTDDGFFSRAYDVVRQIPKGRVATYGQVARVMGEPRKARFVGFAMHASPGMAGGVPCHRVVFADGRLAPGFAFGGAHEQRRLLEEEGVSFANDGTVDLARCQWEAGL